MVKSGRCRILLYLPIFACFLFSHCTFTHYAKKSYARAEKEKPYDVIIVPGIPYDMEQTSSVMEMRILWAKHLYDNGFAKNIIFSGSAVYTPYVESIAMKIIADSLGIASENIFSETRAEHSTENVYYSWKMAHALGFKKIALATDPFQSRMLKSFVKKYTPGVKNIPVILSMVDLDAQNLPRINASSAFVEDFVSIKERESFWVRLRGTFGQRVREEKKLEASQRRRDALSSNPP